MEKYKKHPKYNVLSIRVTDEERAFMDEIQRHTQKSISKLMREAMLNYKPYLEVSLNQRM